MFSLRPGNITRGAAPVPTLTHTLVGGRTGSVVAGLFTKRDVAVCTRPQRVARAQVWVHTRAIPTILTHGITAGFTHPSRLTLTSVRAVARSKETFQGFTQREGTLSTRPKRVTVARVWLNTLPMSTKGADGNSAGSAVEFPPFGTVTHSFETRTMATIVTGYGVALASDPPFLTVALVDAHARSMDAGRALRGIASDPYPPRLTRARLRGVAGSVHTGGGADNVAAVANIGTDACILTPNTGGEGTGGSTPVEVTFTPVGRVARPKEARDTDRLITGVAHPPTSTVTHIGVDTAPLLTIVTEGDIALDA